MIFGCAHECNGNRLKSSNSEPNGWRITYYTHTHSMGSSSNRYVWMKLQHICLNESVHHVCKASLWMCKQFFRNECSWWLQLNIKKKKTKTKYEREVKWPHFLTNKKKQTKTICIIEFFDKLNFIACRLMTIDLGGRHVQRSKLTTTKCITKHEVMEKGRERERDNVVK